MYTTYVHFYSQSIHARVLVSWVSLFNVPGMRFKTLWPKRAKLAHKLIVNLDQHIILPFKYLKLLLDTCSVLRRQQVSWIYEKVGRGFQLPASWALNSFLVPWAALAEAHVDTNTWHDEIAKEYVWRPSSMIVTLPDMDCLFHYSTSLLKWRLTFRGWLFWLSIVLFCRQVCHTAPFGGFHCSPLWSSPSSSWLCSAILDSEFVFSLRFFAWLESSSPVRFCFHAWQRITWTKQQ